MTLLQREATVSNAATERTDALIEDARQRQRRRRLLVGRAVVVVAAASVTWTVVSRGSPYRPPSPATTGPLSTTTATRCMARSLGVEILGVQTQLGWNYEAFLMHNLRAASCSVLRTDAPPVQARRWQADFSARCVPRFILMLSHPLLGAERLRQGCRPGWSRLCELRNRSGSPNGTVRKVQRLPHQACGRDGDAQCCSRVGRILRDLSPGGSLALRLRCARNEPRRHHRRFRVGCAAG
jgi:hypothetical protein